MYTQTLRTAVVVIFASSLGTACYSGLDPDNLDGYGGGETLGEDGSEASGGESGSGESGGSEGAGDTGSMGTGGESTGTGGESTGTGGESTDTGGESTDTGGESTDAGGESTDAGGESTDTGGESTDTGGESTGGEGGGDMPDNAYCNPVDDWSAAWLAWELEVVELVNSARSSGGNCGAQGNFAPSGPLTWNAELSCAARVHSLDMGEAGYFSHTNLQGNGPGWRLDQAGFAGGGWGENIAAGQSSPAAVVQSWLDSDGHCANMLNGGFAQIGMGYANVNGSQYGHYWTQTFGG